MVAGHPFDTIKVRMQSQMVPSYGIDPTKISVPYHSTFQTMWRIVREERASNM